MFWEEGRIQDPPTVRKLMISLLHGLDSSRQQAQAASIESASSAWDGARAADRLPTGVQLLQ